MIGQMILGETPFGEVLIKAYVDRGWQRECREGDQWAKKPPSIVNLKPCNYSILEQQKGLKL
jgi:hypothetical protein